MTPNVQKLCGRLVRQGFCQVKDLEQIYRDWRAAAPSDRDSVESFAQYLVLRGHVSIDRLQLCLKGLQRPSLNATPPPREDLDFDVELVPPRQGFGRRDLVIAALGAIVGAGIAILIAYLAWRSRT